MPPPQGEGDREAVMGVSSHGLGHSPSQLR